LTTFATTGTLIVPAGVIHGHGSDTEMRLPPAGLVKAVLFFECSWSATKIPTAAGSHWGGPVLRSGTTQNDHRAHHAHGGDCRRAGQLWRREGGAALACPI